MLFPLIVGLAAVALGASIALGSPAGTRAIGPIRILSVVAAVGVIGWHLLPEAWAEIGAWSVVAFIGGLAVPKAVETVAERIAGRSIGHGHGHGEGHASHAALDIGYAGLIVHRFGDGLSMGAYSKLPNSAAASAPVLLAFAAHIVPVTTVMVLAALTAKGRRTAVYYAVGLGAAIAAGVLLATAALTALSHGIEPWISAVVAGLLLHVVVHTGLPGSMFGKKKE
jgi:zinc transporter ZupT